VTRVKKDKVNLTRQDHIELTKVETMQRYIIVTNVIKLVIATTREIVVTRKVQSYKTFVLH
jgi:hypothetical protein